MIKLTITDNTGATITATNEYFIETLLELSYQENPAFIPFFDELAFYAEDLRAERSPMVSDDDVAEEAFWDLLPEFGLKARKWDTEELKELLYNVTEAEKVADYLFRLASGRMTHRQARYAITNHPAMLLHILESI